MENQYDLIIVGGGPGGIASAVEASIFGVKRILLIEKGDNHSQTIRQYYKDAKRVDRNWQGQNIEFEGNVEFFDGTKESTLEHFESLLDHDAIDAIFECEVDRVLKENEETFSVLTPKGTFFAPNVIVAIGKMGKPNKPDYKIPPTIKKVVNFNPYDAHGQEKILVVGGGDSAVEYASELCCINDVTLSYRKGSFSRVNDINKEIIERYDQEEKSRVRFEGRTVIIKKTSMTAVYTQILVSKLLVS